MKWVYDTKYNRILDYAGNPVVTVGVRPRRKVAEEIVETHNYAIDQLLEFLGEDLPERPEEVIEIAEVVELDQWGEFDDPEPPGARECRKAWVPR